MSNNKTVAVTTPFFPLLTILFIALKLTNTIDWSWWWVLSPLWGPFALVFGVLIVFLLVKLPFALYADLKERRSRQAMGKWWQK